MEMTRCHGNIVCAVFRWFSVRAGIDPEHGEVSGVPGPHPVVRIAAVLAHGLRWSAYQPHVLEGFHGEEVELISVKEAAHEGVVMRIAFGFLGDLLADRTDGLAALIFRHLIIEYGIDPIGHIFDLDQKCGGQPLIGQLLCLAHRPKSVFEVIVFLAGMAADGIVAAVVLVTSA